MADLEQRLIAIEIITNPGQPFSIQSVKPWLERNSALRKEASAEITRLRAALADAQAVGFAAGVEAAAKRCDAIAGNTADFNQYHRRAAGQCGAAIRAIAGATEMTDSTNAKLLELRERVAGMPCYDSDGDPAGLFDHHVFVRREDVLRLIDAMMREAGE